MERHIVAARWGWIALVLSMALPACSAERISVAQLEDILTQSQKLPDGDLAAKLASLQLAERLPSARLAQWRAALRGA